MQYNLFTKSLLMVFCFSLNLTPAAMASNLPEEPFKDPSYPSGGQRPVRVGTDIEVPLDIEEKLNGFLKHSNSKPKGKNRDLRKKKIESKSRASIYVIWSPGTISTATATAL
jgi:hypothetical protein